MSRSCKVQFLLQIERQLTGTAYQFVWLWRSIRFSDTLLHDTQNYLLHVFHLSWFRTQCHAAKVLQPSWQAWTEAALLQGNQISSNSRLRFGRAHRTRLRSIRAKIHSIPKNADLGAPVHSLFYPSLKVYNVGPGCKTKIFYCSPRWPNIQCSIEFTNSNWKQILAGNNYIAFMLIFIWYSWFDLRDHIVIQLLLFLHTVQILYTPQKYRIVIIFRKSTPRFGCSPLGPNVPLVLV